MRWTLFLPCAVWCACAASCGGSPANNTDYAEAAVVVGIAATAQAIQSARAQSKSPSNGAPECCTQCGRCEFPCGDKCLPQGSICLKPQGCACAYSNLPSGDEPTKPDLSCGPGRIDPAGEQPAPDAVFVPLISY